MLTAYVYCRKEKPNMKILMAPLVDKINQTYEQGIQFETPYGSQHVHSILFMVSADLPARAELMNMKYYSGTFSCHACFSKGLVIGKHVKWPFIKSFEKRKSKYQERLGREAEKVTESMQGVKGTSIFSQLKHPFDLVTGFAIDWMHCICLGVVKAMIHLMFQIKSSPSYIGNKLNIVNGGLRVLKPPNIVRHLPGSIGDMKKATELKHWLFHYSIATLHGLLDPVLLLHWSLLVGGDWNFVFNHIDE